MKRLFLRSVLALGLVAGGLAGVSQLSAQEPARQELPRAEDILDREAKAVGVKAIKTVVMKMKFSDQDMQFDLVLYDAGPNKHCKVVRSEGLRTAEIVVSGDAAWVKDSITGARFLKGEEKERAFRDAEGFRKEICRVSDWRKQYKQVRTVAEEKVAGKPAYKVQLTTPKGEEVIAHYDKQSGQLVRQERDIETPEGKQRVIEFFGDHREVGGCVLPFSVRVVRGSAEFSATVERLEINVDIPEERFALPAELKKLQTQR